MLDTQLAKMDARQLELCICRASLRKSVPQWSCPVEVWRMLFKVDKYKSRSGLGFTPTETTCHMLRRRLFQLCLCIRIRARTPRLWNRGLGAQLDKSNGKDGCAGKRLVNQLDPVGSQFYKHMWARTSPRSYRRYASGYYSGKSRISAIMQRHILSSRLDAAHIRHIESFFDVSNAFPSPCHNALDAAVYTVANRDDIEILLQRHREAITHIVASDKAVDIRSGSGAMQGDGPAGPLFLEVYHPQVDTWLGVVQLLPQQRLCCAQDPVSQVYVDCSLTAYADDLGKTTVVTNKQDALDKIRSINNSLDTALACIGMAQNGIKQENVVHATGRHSGSFLRDMYTQGVGIGKTVAIAKYLGARRSYNNLFHH